MGSTWRMATHFRSASTERRWRFDDRQHHQSCSPARQRCKRGAQAACIGRSRGGLSTKLHAAVDGKGNPQRFLLSPGQDSDIRHAKALLKDLNALFLIGDKGYDSQSFVSDLKSQGILAVIPSRQNRKIQRYYNRKLYKDRNGVERFFARLKQFRRITTRYEKKAENYLAMVYIASTRLLLK